MGMFEKVGKIGFDLQKEYSIADSHYQFGNVPTFEGTVVAKIGSHEELIFIEIPLKMIDGQYEPIVPTHFISTIERYCCNNKTMSKALKQAFNDENILTFEEANSLLTKDNPLAANAEYFDILYLTYLENVDIIYNKIRELIKK